MRQIFVLACLLLLVGFFVAGCEDFDEHEEHEFHHEHHARYGGYRGGGYPNHGYQLLDESVQNDGLWQVESTVQA